ncbi:MAG TPA: hypothetical protein VF263_18530 [Longimicrobiaceae bacterium]
MRRTLLVAAGLLLSLSAVPACARVPATPAATPSVTVPAGFREMSLADFTRLPSARDVPIRFRLPEGLVPWKRKDSDVLYWMTPADTAVVSDPLSLQAPDGEFYFVHLSRNVGYDQARRMFTGEDEMAATFGRMNFDELNLERWNVGGYPVLFVEYRRDTSLSAMVYVGTLVGDNAVLANYAYTDPPGEADHVRWKTLKEGILASGPAERVW